MMKFVRYVIVGVSSNLTGYLVYLALTLAGVGPKLAMSLLYGFGATLSYFGNRRWTFHHDGSVGASAVRFALVYAAPTPNRASGRNNCGSHHAILFTSYVCFSISRFTIASLTS
jgi:hypothetical protein